MRIIIDVIIIFILGFFFIAGIRRGLIRQILQIAAIIVAFVAAFYLAHYMGAFLEQTLELTYHLSVIVAAILIFVAILFSFHLIGLAFQKVINITPLGNIDRFGGGLFGAFKGVLLVSLILVIMFHLPFPDDFRAELYRDPLVRALYPVLPMIFDLIVSRSQESLNFEKVFRTADATGEQLERAVDAAGKHLDKGKGKIRERGAED